MKKQIETERKYIIAMPTESATDTGEFCESEIEQIYLCCAQGQTHRIRRRSFPKTIEYTENIKIRISKMSSIETEREISAEEYSSLSQNIDPKTRPLYKKRCSFLYEGQTVDIDIYPEWKSTAVMEIELPSEDIEPKIPPFIKVIAEVTGQRAYSNRAMAADFPKELYL